MKKPVNAFLLGLFALGLLVADISLEKPFGVGLAPDAEARFGRPVTPVSFAGVARRTTRRAVVATSTVVAADTTPDVVVVDQPAPTTVAIGTVVTTLPAGCETHTIDGVEYHKCAGAYYRAAFQGNNLVYVVSQP